MNRGSKPRLASNEIIEITNPSKVSAGLDSASHAVDLPPSVSERAGSLLRAVAGISIAIATLGVLIYLALASTVMIVAKPLDMNAVVLRGVYPIGQAPKGAVMLATSGTAAAGVIDKLGEGTIGVDAASVVTIVTGPSSKVYNDPSGQIMADGKPTGYWAPLDARDLSHQYIAICDKGACKPGAAVLIGERSLIGEVKGYITKIGPLSKPTTPTVATTGTKTP